MDPARTAPKAELSRNYSWLNKHYVQVLKDEEEEEEDAGPECAEMSAKKPFLLALSRVGAVGMVLQAQQRRTLKSHPLE